PSGAHGRRGQLASGARPEGPGNGRARMRRAALRALPAVGLAVVLVGAWELYVDLAGVEAALLPAPHDVASSLWNSAELLLRNFRVTAEEVVLGLALALAAGFALAV